MIGFLQGEVLFSDGNETILLTANGIGHQIHCFKLLSEGSKAGLYVSQIFRENSQVLYGFTSLKEKKAFELLLSVKGVGPKSAYSLVHSLDFDGVVRAVTLEDKKLLQKAPGVGAKAAAQIILDLSGKIKNLHMYSTKYQARPPQFELSITAAAQVEEITLVDSNENISSDSTIIHDTLMACKELGFNEDHVYPMALKLLEQNDINRSEQLLHLVLKEM